jgi:hypothetical protein
VLVAQVVAVQIAYLAQSLLLVVVSLEITQSQVLLVVLVVAAVGTKAQEAVLLTKVLPAVLLLMAPWEDKVEVEQVQLVVSQPQAEQTSFLVALVELVFQATLLELL